MAINIRPLDDKVVVKPLEKDAESKTAGGIVIPDTASGKDKPMVGMVEAVGPGKVLEDGSVRAIRVKVGEKVLCNQYAGTKFEKHLVVNESDLLAVVED